MGQRYLELEPESSLGWDREGAEPPADEPEEEEAAAAPPPPNWKMSVFLAILTGCGLIFFVTKWGSHAASGVPTAQMPLPTTTFEAKKAEIVVDVKGQVHNPGVVRLPVGSRAIDAIKACGGFTDKANRMAVNLAAKLHDEEMLPIPKIGEALPTPTETPVADATPGESASPTTSFAQPPEPPPSKPSIDTPLTPAPTLTPGHFQGGPVEAIDTPAKSTPSPRPPRPRLTPSVPSSGGTPELTADPTGEDPTGGPPKPANPASPVAVVNPGSKVSLNRATADQLAGIPGMTARLAADVVAYRRGPPPRAFTSIDELNKVPTLTPAKIDEITPYLKL